MPSRLIKKKEQVKIQDKFMQLEREDGELKLKLTPDVDTSLVQLDDIVDTQGNKRFIEGNGEITSLLPTDNIDNVYCKWSLSGTHLMLVLSFYNKVDTVVPAEDFGYNSIVNFTLPDYIMNKIIPIFTIGNYRLITASNGDYFGANALNPRYGLGKYRGKLTVEISGSNPVTFKAGTSNRFQLDLLIDTDY